MRCPGVCVKVWFTMRCPEMSCLCKGMVYYEMSWSLCKGMVYYEMSCVKVWFTMRCLCKGMVYYEMSWMSGVCVKVWFTMRCPGCLESV